MSTSKRGCQPFNWLVDGFNYLIKLKKGISFALSAQDILIKDDEAEALDVKEGSNSYLRFVTTDGGEKLLAGKALEADRVQAASAPFSGAPLAVRPALAHGFFEDFIIPYDSGQWDENNVDGGGDSSEVCAVNDGVGGELTLTTNDAEDDAEQRTYKTETFKLESGKPLWFEARAKASEATEIDLMIGLIANEDLTAVGDNLPADGIVFLKDDGDTEIDVNSSKDGTDSGGQDVATLDTDYHRYGIYFDGDSSIEMYLDGEKVDTRGSTICDDEELAPSVMVKAGDANARTLTVDYIRVVQER